MKFVLTRCVVAFVAIAPTFAQAQSTGVTAVLSMQRVEVVGGATVLKTVTAVNPGDLIEYSTVYRNDGANAVTKMRAVIPIPAGATYQAASAVPIGAQASLNGIDFEAMPVIRTMRQPDGSERKIEVPLGRYRALRWELGTLLPAQSTTVRLRAQIDRPEPVAAPK